ncbi:MAG: hypothetical protein JXJ20_02235 [Anaerolineae bacterium]|nr:hypothetical protein [Anaerolineae bacterium]
MPNQSKILLIDAAINLILGLLLVALSDSITDTLGVPHTDQKFYASILGGVFIGITIALVVEALRGPAGLVGLGLGGAISINLCGGLTLTAWLIAGDLDLPTKGRVFLWGLAILLVAVSSSELWIHIQRRRVARDR